MQVFMFYLSYTEKVIFCNKSFRGIQKGGGFLNWFYFLRVQDSGKTQYCRPFVQNEQNSICC